MSFAASDGLVRDRNPVAPLEVSGPRNEAYFAPADDRAADTFESDDLDWTAGSQLDDELVELLATDG